MKCTAIDLGSSSIKLLVGSYDGDQFVIASSQEVKSIGIKRGIILNIANTSRELQLLKAEAEKATGEPIRQVVCNINGLHINSYNAGSEGSALLDDFPGVVVQSAVISNIKRCMDQAGLSVTHFVPNALASCYAWMAEEEDPECVLAVDAGAQTYSVGVFDAGHFRDTMVYSVTIEEHALVSEVLSFLDDGGYAIDRVVLTGGGSMDDVVFKRVADELNAGYRIGYPHGLSGVNRDVKDLLVRAVALGMIRWVNKSSDNEGY